MTTDNLYDTELYKLLVKKLPVTMMQSRDRLDTDKIATAIGMSRFAIYRWCRGDRMRVTSAEKLVKLSTESDCARKGALKLDMLKKFILGF